jgi:hypothetical protein
MTKISGWTTFYKKIFPVIMFGFVLVILLMGAVSGVSGPEYYLVPIGMCVFIYFLLRRMIWDLVDEVYDAGDYLVFKNDGREQRVQLEEITEIDYQNITSPERVTVHCRNEGTLGNKLVFCLPPRLFKLRKSSVVTELIERVERARLG